MKTCRRSTRLFSLLGLAVLVGCVIFSLWLPSASRNGGQALADDLSAGTIDSAVVCFGHVDLEDGVTALAPLRSGRVAEVPVKENDQVEAGAVLLRLEDRAAALQVQEAQTDLEAAQAHLLQVRSAPQQHQARLAQQRAGVLVAQRRLVSAQVSLTRKRELLASNLIDKLEVDMAIELVGELQAVIEAEKKKLQELELLTPQNDVALAEAGVAAKEVRLEQARQALSEFTLRAPSDGKILRVQVGRGDLLGVQAKSTAILFCPEGPRLIRAEVVQEFAHLISSGRPALIQDDANPAIRARGTVTRISDWYTQRRSVLQEPLQHNDVRTLECLITLDSTATPLRIGQRVRVTIGRSLAGG